MLQVETDVFVKHKSPLIMADSKDGQGHKDKYLDTIRKILSKEMPMCNMSSIKRLDGGSTECTFGFDPWSQGVNAFSTCVRGKSVHVARVLRVWIFLDLLLG